MVTNHFGGGSPLNVLAKWVRRNGFLSDDARVIAVVQGIGARLLEPVKHVL